MQSQVAELSPILVEVKVAVPWERVKKDLDASYGEIARSARIRGFRPGKAPRQVVRQLYGKQVKEEVSAQLIEEGLRAAVEEHDIQLVAQPEVDPPELRSGEPFEFTAKCEVRPTIESVDVSSLEIHRPAHEVANADVDEEVERLRAQNAELRAPSPMRPAQAGDELLIDYRVYVGEDEVEDLAATDRPVELGAGRLLPELEEGLLGRSPGDDASIEVPFEEDHPREDLRGRTATFRVAVKELREKLLPELDDEFAKDCGDYETLLELRLDVRKRLEQMAERRANASLREQVVDRLVETNDVPVPPSMIKTQERQMMMELVQLMQMGMSAPDKDVLDGMKVRAERRVRAAILLGALARQEGIEVGDDDVDAKMREIAEQTGKHVAKVRVDYAGEKREELESQILEEKLMDFLLARAHIKDGPPPEARNDSEAGDDSESEDG